MKIIIAGAYAIGSHLAKLLSRNNQDIVLIDDDEQRLENISSDCENIIRYFKDSDKVNVALVVANKTGIPALEKAERLGVPTRVLPKADLNREDVVLPLMKEYSIDFIVLAGFLLVIPDFLIHEYDHRMINLHPALLPKFGGMGMYGHHVHEAVKAAGETETGMTVHWVSGKVDSGGIIAQFR